MLIAVPMYYTAQYGSCANYVTACFLGASIIYVDLIVRKLPGLKDFRIQDSSGFLAASLSLSFGVMVSRLDIISPCQLLTPHLDLQRPEQHVTFFKAVPYHWWLLNKSC